MRSGKDLWRGVANHPWQALQAAFTAFSMAFTLIQGLEHFVPGVKIHGRVPFSIVIIGSLAWGLVKVWKPSKISLCVANCNTTLEIAFGDLFAQEGVRAIAVSEFFESVIGKAVSVKSLHGAFLTRCFGGTPDALDRQLDAELAAVPYRTVEKAIGKRLCYPIGTTALVSVNQDRYLLFALTNTDPSTLKVSATVDVAGRALHGLWQKARIECNGDALNLPLVGSGLSGLNLPTNDLLNVLILSIITETKAREITPLIRIILGKDRFDRIDLRDVERHWKENK